MARKKRELQEINAGSMADIAFLLLIFFLVTTTMDIDTGLMRVLPPFVDEPPEDSEVNKRNVFVVLANAQDNLLVEDEYMQVENLKEAAKQFIIGKPNNPGDERFPLFERAGDKPESNALVIKYWGADYPVSKQIISLQNDRGTSYELYIQIQDALASAYQEVRDEVAMDRFGRTYDDLQKGNEKEKEQAKAVKRLIAQRISEAEPKDIGQTP